MNFMNAIVHERADKSLVYVAGKSVLDEQLGLTPEIAEKIDFIDKNELENRNEYIKTSKN